MGAECVTIYDVEKCEKTGCLKVENFIRITATPEQTEEVGFEVAELAREVGFIALYGDLGAGKTAFVRGVAKKVAPGAAVSSPTYSIVNEYSPAGERKPTLFHFDMYRITDEDSLYSIDFDAYFERGALMVTEWSENIEDALEDAIVITIHKTGETSRRIEIEGGENLADFSI